MGNRLLFGLCLALLPLAPCHAADKNAPTTGKTVACTYNHKQPNASGAAELTIKDRKVSRIYFKSYYPGGPGELSFVCDIDLNRDDASYSWQDEGAGITIKTKETGDTVQLIRKKKGYNLNFANLNRLSKYCGAGAVVPEDVFIPQAGKHCKVTMPR